MLGDELKNIWQNDLKEIQENKFRFAGLCICFVAASVLLLTDDGGGEEIVLNETPAPVAVETAKKVDSGTKIIAVKSSATSNADKNIKVVLGANSNDLLVGDPFKIPPKEKVKPPEIPTAITAPPVAQVPTLPPEKFILRGTAIFGNNKTALIQKIIGGDKKTSEEDLILGIGDRLKGKKIIDIATDSLVLEDGEILYLETQY